MGNYLNSRVSVPLPLGWQKVKVPFKIGLLSTENTHARPFVCMVFESR